MGLVEPQPEVGDRTRIVGEHKQDCLVLVISTKKHRALLSIGACGVQVSFSREGLLAVALEVAECEGR